jgi:sugar lactone lactonase YvrE
MGKHYNYRACACNPFLFFLIFLFGGSSQVHAQLINSIAGNGVGGYNGEGSPATAKELNNPFGVAVDAAGNVYVAEINNNRVRKITPGGVISTFAGNGTATYGSDGIAATASSLFNPYGVTVDAAGNVYIADQGSFRIRKVNTAGIISTVAGSGSLGYSGDGFAATDAALAFPTAVAVDAGGNIYIADYGNNVIRKVDATGTISTFAGNGTPTFLGDGGPATNASLWNPEGVAVDAVGNVYIADWSNSVVRKVNTSGVISSFAGFGGASGFGGDGSLATGPFARLFNPTSVAIDATGNVYIADEGNQRIRKVDPSGIISTFGGTTAGFSGDGGSPAGAQFNNPTGVAIASSGKIYIADMTNNRVREVTFPVVVINPITGNTNVCIGGTSALSDATTGGTWSSSNTTVATIDATGLVTGVSGGVATITYATPTGHATAGIFVGNNFVNLGRILGLNYVCPGFSVILNDYVAGGVWSSSDVSIATVSNTGIVQGITSGTCNIYYTLSNSCGGSASLKYPFTVLPTSGCSTGIPSLNSSPENEISAWPNPNDGTFSVKLSSATDEGVHLTITNVVGERIKEYTTTTNSTMAIKLDAPVGVYFLDIVSAHGRWNKRVLVNH